jgi:GTP-binding protein
MPEKVVAIVGRPNVGKSTLFNRLTGKRSAIVHETPGVTRDRNYGEVEWNGKKFFLIDTGGYIPDSKDTFEAAIREQVKISIEEADIILFVVDGQSGLTPLDEEIADILRKEKNKKSDKSEKSVILTFNKADAPQHEINKSDFYRLGMGEPVEVSAITGRKSGDLLDRIVYDLRGGEAAEEIPPSSTKESEICKIAIIGRPNVGKSSVVNAITQSTRNIVTDIPGTTRDSIDTIVKYHGKDILLIDTAGLRKKSKIKRAESLEYYSAIRTHRSLERCDVAIIVIDAVTILTKLKKSSDYRMATFKLDKEDAIIISEAAKLKKGILIAINKWDLIEKENNTLKLFESKIKEHLKSYNFLQFIFISAQTKQRISKVIEEAVNIYQERQKEIKTSELNAKLINLIKNSPPVSKSRREVKINYITQLKSSPPVFGFFTNLPSEIEENYKRFLEDRIREYFGFRGVPITLVFKKKN